MGTVLKPYRIGTENPLSSLPSMPVVLDESGRIVAMCPEHDDALKIVLALNAAEPLMSKTAMSLALDEPPSEEGRAVLATCGAPLVQHGTHATCPQCGRAASPGTRFCQGLKSDPAEKGGGE